MINNIEQLYIIEQLMLNLKTKQNPQTNDTFGDFI